MSCPAALYKQVNRQVFDTLNSKLTSLGYRLPGPEGEVEGPMGIVLKYRWLEADGVLQAKITKKPMLVPCSTIMGKIDDAITQAGGVIG